MSVNVNLNNGNGIESIVSVAEGINNQADLVNVTTETNNEKQTIECNAIKSNKITAISNIFVQEQKSNNKVNAQQIDNKQSNILVTCNHGILIKQCSDCLKANSGINNSNPVSSVTCNPVNSTESETGSLEINIKKENIVTVSNSAVSPDSSEKNKAVTDPTLINYNPPVPVKSATPQQSTKYKKLTKEFILSKSRADNLFQIKKINIWGQGITDCSLVTELPELEVATMSANKISSLEHFGQCPNLRELFLRNNCIEDLAEIYHLRDLPSLQVLWLKGNPCARLQYYRFTVIRNLEQLQTLDDKEITPEERELAEVDGILYTQPPGPAIPVQHDTSSQTDEEVGTLSRFAMGEIRTSVLHLLRLLDSQGLELVMQTARNRLQREFNKDVP